MPAAARSARPDTGALVRAHPRADGDPAGHAVGPRAPSARRHRGLGVLALVAAGVLGAAPVRAAEGDLVTDATLVSDYRWRGISQSRLGPALQGGLMLEQQNAYATARLSTVRWVKDANGNAPAELLLQAGMRGRLTPELTWHLGGNARLFPAHDLATSPDTVELHAGASMGVFTVRLHHGLTNFVGWSGSRGSRYLEIEGHWRVAGVDIVPHVGVQSVPGRADLDGVDYGLTVSRAFQNVLLSAALVGSEADGWLAPDGRRLGRDGLVLAASWRF
jgi:uncharacterized protein (TIGR02001 family)